MIDAHSARVRWIVASLALLAFVRVAFFALSFPFFGHMDEISHVDLVYRHAAGNPPSADDDAYVAETIEMFTFYSSAEWIDLHGAEPPPLPAQFDLPDEMRRAALEQKLAEFGGKPNHEALEAPPYYAVAGQWLNLARWLGLGKLDQLYFVRLLGAFMLAGGVVFAHLFARRLVPDRSLLWLGLPTLVAVFPQDVFYFINNDVPSILFFSAALWLAVRMRDRVSGIVESLVLGILVGLMFIAKAPNMTLMFAVLAIVGRPWQLDRKRVSAILGFFVPTATWHVWLFRTSGHLTPSFHKCEVLGITPKHSIAAWFDHPIYTWDGFRWFWGRLIDHFWRGEIEWHGKVMSIGWIDTLLAWSTPILCGVAILATLRRRRDRLPDGTVLGTCIAILVGFAIMVLISVAFDFGPNMYPSREEPYLVTGRVHNGMIVLIGLLYLDGLDRVTRRFGRIAPWVALAALAVTLLAYEVIVTIPVVRSPHNFWHLDV
ncbi:MAG: DUF2142 domain-containing protein [Planctomycetes bacterium]|nr:DUF2142 domain-containing protein [Planctomycetota bacterium]